VAAIAFAAAEWRDPTFPPRVATAEAIRARLRFSPPVVDHALDRLFADIDARSIEDAIASELGSLDALDGFAPRAGRPAAFARGVERVTIVSSDTTIGVAIPSMIFALCAKAHVTVKDRSDAFVRAFAATLASHEPAFAGSLDVSAWESEDREDNRGFQGADVVLAFGGARAMRAIRERCDPGARFVAFGHRTSVGYVGRADLASADATHKIADGAALDALLYDGTGCLSLHAVFLEAHGESAPDRFADILAEACERVARRFPAGEHRSLSTASYRDRAEFRAASGFGSVHVGTAGAYLIVTDPPPGEPPPFLPGVIAIYTVESPEEAFAFLDRHHIALEACAVGPHADLNALVAASGGSSIARFCPFGDLQSPPLSGDHGGVGRITPFVHWISRA
jgi:hypothetical protein